MYYLVEWIKFSVKKTKHLKNTVKVGKKKYWKSRGILSVRKSRNHDEPLQKVLYIFDLALPNCRRSWGRVSRDTCTWLRPTARREASRMATTSTFRTATASPACPVFEPDSSPRVKSSTRKTCGGSSRVSYEKGCIKNTR